MFKKITKFFKELTYDHLNTEVYLLQNENQKIKSYEVDIDEVKLKEFVLKADQEITKLGVPDPEIFDVKKMMVKYPSKTQFRNPNDVVRKILVIMHLYMKANNKNILQFESDVEALELKKYMNEDEIRFIETPNDKISKELANQYSWMLEGAYVLAWSIGLFENISDPVKHLNYPNFRLDVLGSFSKHRAEASFLPTYRNNITEIVYYNQLYLKLHWAFTDARMRGQSIDFIYDQGIVAERLRAVRWLTWLDYDWNDTGALFGS